MDCNDEENLEWLMESSKTVEKAEENGVDILKKGEESIELYRFLHVLRTCFEDEPILDETKAKGTVNCEEDIQKLITRLKALGYFFSVRTSGCLFPASKGKVDKLNRIMVINKIFPPSHPYRVISHSYYYCSQRSKEPEEVGQEHHIAATNSFPKCKAVMEIRQIEIFTTVSIPKNKRKRVEILKRFRRKLINNPEMLGKIKYEVVVSLPKTHNHSCDFTGKHLSEEVKAALYYVFRTGTTSVEGIQEKLYQIVDREFENDPVKPSRDNTAFYPTQRTIYYHLKRDGIEVKRVHRDNANRLIELKNKTREVLNSLAEKVEMCSDLEIIFRLYSRIKNVDNCFENIGIMEQNAFEQESYSSDTNSF